ncbi:hypothetical protein [Streptomyces brevispora]|uniref:Uncharacterized protein n=1 Tax=Streptomyces brevispora TaxID=887462 RepID=A0A561UVP3_9ACTN|nr:hypothetical protein [Streptomyces brevispora]TWG03416.1 hypothetical protein FHX80_111842 [Streptomyces brevispora]WSC15546.1 hypothetical protein OIE64_23730 [Streptomyces brevispora]
MPRPTAAQLSYGSVTVVFSTLAMLLLSGTGSELGIAVICTAALALGLLVAVTVPAPARRRTGTTGAAVAALQDAGPAAEPGGRTPGQVQRTIPAARASERVGEHSLRR